MWVPAYNNSPKKGPGSYTSRTRNFLRVTRVPGKIETLCFFKSKNFKNILKEMSKILTFMSPEPDH